MNETTRIHLLTPAAHAADDDNASVFALANDADPLDHRDAIANASRVELHFPQFTDGRAYSQAYLIRKRLRYTGDLRATGDLLADQLIQMERTGFSSAVLKEGIELADARRQLERFDTFYQADVVRDAPYRRAAEK